ncbi:MAG: cache domain-containing protein [Oligoflexia bacterium]|nr:cache domain-containing protein [Oligoflexia bacterium]
MNMMNVKISNKVLALSFSAILMMMTILLVNYFSTKKSIDELIEQVLMAQINKAHIAIKHAAIYQKISNPQIDNLKKDLLEHAIGRTGYLYVLDLKGNLVIHPKLEGKNLYDVKDANNNFFVQEIINKKNGKIIYPWKNPGENSERDKIVYFKYIEETNWIVAAGSYFDEIYEPLSKFIYTSLILFLIAITILSAVTLIIYRNLELLGNQIIGMCKMVNGSSQEIAKGNADLSSRNSEQASSLEETASTMQEITSTIKQTTHNLGLVADLAKSSVKSVDDGVKISYKTQESMNEISNSSSKIADILKLVEEIAFQTNILAINAAIEAAKAGEQGKGFAVVAIEVRDLAQRASSAAIDIRKLINTSLEKVESGGMLTESNKGKLEEISAEIAKMSALINEVLASIQEQFVAIEQINTAVSNIDTTTQQNAGLVEQMASTSENLTGKASELEKLLEINFKSAA